jgi:citrate lyase subunit beta/citryl-CoA lyase
MADRRRTAVRDWRTLLFVPADRPEMLAKAAGRGADAIVVDLEDAVAPGAKRSARASLAACLDDGALSASTPVCVRINPLGEGGEEDLVALAGQRLDAVMLPKAAGRDVVGQARKAIDSGFEGGERVGLIPLVESASGILDVGSLARVEGVSAVAFGGEDFCVHLGVERSAESLELLMPRALIGLHACDAGLPAFDTVYTAIDDEAGLVKEARTARQLGFSGKLLIHPGQVEPVRRAFTPSEEELAWARRVLATQSEVGEGDVGVHVLDGKMVDAPVVARAERILARGLG